MNSSVAPAPLAAAIQGAEEAIQAAMPPTVDPDGISTGIQFNTGTINTGITVPATVQAGDVDVAMGAIASARDQKSADSATSVTMVAFTEVANNLAKQVLVVASGIPIPREVVSKTAAELATFTKNVVDDFVSELLPVIVPGAPTEKTALQITMEAANNDIDGNFQVPQAALDARGTGEDAMAKALAVYFNAASLSDARAALATVEATIPMTEGHAAKQAGFWRAWLETLLLQAQLKAALNTIDAERTRVLSVLARLAV